VCFGEKETLASLCLARERIGDYRYNRERRKKSYTRRGRAETQVFGTHTLSLWLDHCVV
jgi:hypothetical protein